MTSPPATNPSLAGALTRALLPWIAMLWVATSAAVGWYMQFPISYRDLELMPRDWGVSVDHTTRFR